MCRGFGSAHCLSQWWAARKEDLTPNPACSVWWLPRCLSYSTSWIMWGWVDIFIWSTNDTLKPQSWCVYWLGWMFPRLSSAYINIFSAPFTLSIAVVMKSALCHVHLKYLMFLRSWNLPPDEWTLELCLAVHERKYYFYALKVKPIEQVDLWNLWRVCWK